MTRSVQLTPEAEGDIQETFAWYEARQRDLGRTYIEELDGVFLRIADAPHHYPAIHRHLRRALLRRFPYAVYFFETDDSIVVVAVLNQRRNPEAWLERLDED